MLPSNRIRSKKKRKTRARSLPDGKWRRLGSRHVTRTPVSLITSAASGVDYASGHPLAKARNPTRSCPSIFPAPSESRSSELHEARGPSHASCSLTGFHTCPRLSYVSPLGPGFASEHLADPRISLEASATMSSSSGSTNVWAPNCVLGPPPRVLVTQINVKKPRSSSRALVLHRSSRVRPLAHLLGEKTAMISESPTSEF